MIRTERRLLRSMAGLGLVALAVGCLSLPEGSPEPRRWVLAPTSQPVATEGAEFALGLGPIELASYLERTAIVERLGGNEIRARQDHVWGETLQVGIQRIMEVELTRRLPGLFVVGFPWKGPAVLDYRLTLQLARFEHDVPAEEVAIEARWALRDMRSGELVEVRVTTLREPVESDDMADVTAAMSRAIEQLAGEIAGPIGEARREATEMAERAGS